MGEKPKRVDPEKERKKEELRILIDKAGNEAMMIRGLLDTFGKGHENDPEYKQLERSLKIAQSKHEHLNKELKKLE